MFEDVYFDKYSIKFQAIISETLLSSVFPINHLSKHYFAKEGTEAYLGPRQTSLIQLCVEISQ